MKEKFDFEERRQHTRADVKNVVIGILNTSEPELIGSITDISLGGVKFTYNEQNPMPEKQSIESIDLIADSNYLYDIPCDYAWHKKLSTEPDSEISSLSQYGIQFGKLSPWQACLLRSIIEDCDTLGIKTINSSTGENLS